MDSFDDDSIESSPEKVNDSVHDLLEEGWFFGKVLYTKPKMLRWYSDPSPRIAPEVSADPSSNQDFFSAKKVSNRLSRAPSLPPFVGREDQILDEQDKGSCKQVNKLSRQLSVDQTLVRKLTKPSCTEKQVMEIKERTSAAVQSMRWHNLLRTPSLPPCIGREEDEDSDGDEISMSRLIRQAMPNSSDFLPPRHASNKCIMQISTMPKYRPPRNSEPESTNITRSNDQKHRNPNQRILKKSLSNVVDFQQVLKDKDITYDLKTTNTSHNHQERHRNNQYLNRTRRPCIPEAWHAQSCAPPIPIWDSKNSAEDMKAQLKFWARAVASNVR